MPRWEGTPFDERNRGALLTPTDLICQIGDPQQMEAVLIVDQAYIDLVQRRARRCGCCSKPTRARPTTAKIEEIADTEVKVASPRHVGARPAAGWKPRPIRPA